MQCNIDLFENFVRLVIESQVFDCSRSCVCVYPSGVVVSHHTVLCVAVVYVLAVSGGEEKLMSRGVYWLARGHEPRETFLS